MAITKLYIVYYSLYGHVETMAREIQKGANSVPDVEATLWQVPETLPNLVLEKMKAPAKPDDVPVIRPEQLVEADGFLFGFPSRFGVMAAQCKAFFDATGDIWAKQALAGKPAGIFWSTGFHGGGQELTALTAVTQLAHHGMLYVPLGYTFGTGMFEMEQVKGGSSYGAGTYAADGTRQPIELELQQAFHQGKLPNYVVIEQRYFDIDLLPANDDHPSHDVAMGQKFVKEVYETLRASPQWKEMAILITYDEHGGFYDHVPTPVKGVPNPDGIIGPDPWYFRFDRLGVRVPTLLISPWVDKGTVIHEPNGPTPTSQYEHSSIPATVKKLFNLRSNFLTKRDAWAGSFENYFKLRSTPRDDCPETLPEVKTTLRTRGPDENLKLTEFQVELIQLASQLNGDHILNAYPDIGKSMTVGMANRYAEDAVKRFLEAGRAALRAGANESALVTMRPSLTTRTPESEGHEAF